MPSTHRQDQSKRTGFFDTLPERVHAMAMSSTRSANLERAINANLKGLGYGG